MEVPFYQTHLRYNDPEKGFIKPSHLQFILSQPQNALNYE